MIVYRVENSDGMGPFQCNDMPALYGQSWLYTWRSHPHPADDGLLSAISSHHKFGCESIEYLKDWFAASHIVKKSLAVAHRNRYKAIERYDRWILNKFGFKVKKYECPDFKCGRSLTQVTFNPHTATLIEEYPVAILFN